MLELAQHRCLQALGWRELLVKAPEKLLEKLLVQQ